jgi:cAMP-dependent protein kinase regulator
MHPEPDQLRQVPSFEGLNDEDRERLASWLDVEEHSAGSLLTAEGRGGYAFFILEAGEARVERDGTEIGRMGSGDVFGEISLLGDGRRSADVVAISDARVLAMFGTHFREMEAAMPSVAIRLKELAERRSQDLDAGT